ncbi:hypothetical protein PHMEG_00013847 [Phytophthora megakarya]|uniref:Uncharacterized protein n=1 Tax=Phytophthora megakarya TaxID=4795 RepID=A0A225W7E3_9STRA|nr:hypothetical protein PHMEG_00013847 [Phytophthora megakarya]
MVNTPSISKLYPPDSTPIRRFMNKLISHNSGTLPRKLASTPFAVSLLSPISTDEVMQRYLQLQRIVDIAVLDSTRDKKNQLVITLKITLKTFDPTTEMTHETTITFHDVNQLSRILSFCVDKATSDCSGNCEFCSHLATYLSKHYVRDPLVAVVNLGDTVLRKPSLAMHLARLVTFTTEKGVAAPRIATVSKENRLAGVQIVPQLAPVGRNENTKKVMCAAQNKVAAVLYDFFDAFADKTAPMSTEKL